MKTGIQCRTSVRRRNRPSSAHHAGTGVPTKRVRTMAATTAPASGMPTILESKVCRQGQSSLRSSRHSTSRKKDLLHIGAAMHGTPGPAAAKQPPDDDTQRFRRGRARATHGTRSVGTTYRQRRAAATRQASSMQDQMEQMDHQQTSTEAAAEASHQAYGPCIEDT